MSDEMSDYDPTKTKKQMWEEEQARGIGFRNLRQETANKSSSHLVNQLRDADARGVAPPQDWTTRAANEIDVLRNLLREVYEQGENVELHARIAKALGIVD